MINRFVLVIIVILVLNGCKREQYPEPIVMQPEFSLSGTLNGEVFNLQAGNNNLYLTSSLAQNEFGVYQFESSFNSTTCGGCNPVFSVVINDTEALDPGVNSSAAILSPTILDFAMSNSNSDFLTFNFDTPNVPGGNFNWNFGDGNASQQHEPQHTYSTPGIYTVTLNVQGGGGPGCDAEISQTVLAGNNHYLCVPFNIQDGPGNAVILSYPNNLPPHLQAQNWTINGNNYQGNNLHYNIPPGPNPVEICLNFYNTQAGESGQYCLTYDDGPGSNNLPCMTQIHYQFEPAQVNLSNVELTYKSPSGQTYSSISNLNNSSNTNFEILEVNDYAQGIDGHAAKKVSARFNAWLINTDNPNETIYMEQRDNLHGKHKSRFCL